jgi:hypothetical protein
MDSDKEINREWTRMDANKRLNLAEPELRRVDTRQLLAV